MVLLGFISMNLYEVEWLIIMSKEFGTLSLRVCPNMTI